MNQKGFANIILMVAIVVFLSAVGYFIFVKKSETVVQQPTPTLIQTKTPASPAPVSKIDTANWKILRNIAHNYTFKYPPETTIEGTNLLTGENGGSWVYVSDLNSTPTQNIFNVGFLATSSDIKSYTEAMWRINKDDKDPDINNKEVGNITEVTVNGQQAYEFTLTGSYRGQNAFMKLKQKHHFIFIGKGEQRFAFWFPEDNQTSRQILATFDFTE